MKHLVVLLSMIVVVLSADVSFAKANEAQILPTLHVGGTTTDFYGFSWFSYDKGSVTDLDIRKLRLRMDSKWKRIGLFVDADFNNDLLLHGSQSNNWLVEGRLSYDLSDKWSLRAGRLFLTGGCPTPPPFLLETARYPRFPFSLAAWGIQLKGTQGEWDILVETTGASDAPFDSSDGFDRAELGVRAKRHFEEKLWVAGTTQFSGAFVRLALDGEYNPSKSHKFRWAAYAVHERELPDLIGGYVFYAWRPAKWFEVHTQVDYQNKNDLLTTMGVRFSIWKDRLSLIVDYEYNPEEESGNILLRQQFRY